jgi:two-component system response regulator HydG
MMPAVLIVDDHAALREGLRLTLQGQGYEAVTAADGAEALEACRRRQVDLCLLDHRLPGPSGLEVLRDLKAACPEAEVILMTAFGTIELAVEAIRAGASDFLQKPFTPEELLVRLRLAERNAASRRKAQMLEEAAAAEESGLVFADPRIADLMATVDKVAPTNATVLLLGESGTGKEMVAARIHRLSARAAMPFVKVNCAALAEGVLESELFGHEKGAFTGAVRQKKGRVELAHQGTLFLDEVGDLPAHLQVKLLRVLQEGQFERVGGERTLSADVRWIGATHRDLPAMVRRGEFREDLFYRLHVVPLAIPPLRERPADLPLLLDHFAAQLTREHRRPPFTLSPGAREALARYAWPGNVRELKNLVEMLSILHAGGTVEAHDLPPKFGPGGGAGPGPADGGPETLNEAVDALERRLIREALAACGGKVSDAARRLGIRPNTLHYKMKRHGLHGR